MDSRKYTLEHILPENPQEGWEQFSDSIIEEARFRLGNITILEESLNQKAGNKNFEEKRDMYKTSILGITRRIAEENDEWNLDRLAARQRWMASQAKTI